MKYKLISFDFDGTLLNDESKVSDETKNALLSYKEKGYTIVGVTGRNLNSAKKAVDFDMLDYLIINNGVSICDIKENRCYDIDSISKETVFDIIDILDEVDYQFDFISKTTYYFYNKKVNNSVPFFKNIESLDEIDEDIARINLSLKNQDKIDYYFKLISKKFNNINCFIMKDTDDGLQWIAINPKNINKFETLKLLGNKLNINIDEMIFFGDTLNDLEAIEGVGCGVAMGNAISDIKEKAKYVTLSNNEDGIKFFLENENL